MNQVIYAGKHLLTYSVPRHAHSSWELIYCTSGEGSLRFDGFSIAYREHDLVIIPPMVQHSNDSERGFTNLHLNLVEPRLYLQEPTLIRDTDDLFLFHAMSAAFFFFSTEPGRENALLSSYATVIVDLIQFRLKTPVRSGVVEEIHNAIIRNYPDENFELDRFLQSLPFNYDYLRKRFKSEMGTTPHRLLSETRLQAAAEYLRFPSIQENSISEIAHLCGFREPLYFSRMFKNYYGLSPRDYQRLSQEERPRHDAESIKIRP